MRRTVAVLATVAALLTLAPAHSSSAAAPVREQGYLTMADGTKLAYTLVRPPGPGPFPTLFEYSGYDPGRTPTLRTSGSSSSATVATPTWV